MQGITSAMKNRGQAAARAGIVAGFALPALFTGIHVAPAPTTAPVWTQQTAPAPRLPDPSFASVSCTAPSACVAVGNGLDRQSGGSHALADSWDGTAWTALRVPRPGSTSLSGVSCPSSGTCLAVGGITLGESWLPVAESWNGSTWVIQRTPKPRGTTDAQLSSVSCVSTTRCLAVGTNLQNNQNTPFADTWNGTQWTLVSAPSIPAGATEAQLDSVSCSSRVACTATGSTFIPGGYAPLAERWDGTSWTIQLTPVPPGSPESYFDSVSCSTASQCMAVGIYDTGHSRGAGFVFETLAESWNGTSWTIEPTKKLVYSQLSAVSCIHGTRCFATGSQNDTRLPLAERWTGTKWVVESSVVTPPRHVNDVSFNGISCTTDNTCTAVGGYDGRTVSSGGVSPEYAGIIPLVEQRT
jgi:hypothetical protein